MDGDLRDQIGQLLSPDVARQLAVTVGLDDREGRTFVDAAIPALLSALGSLDEAGAKALSDAVFNADPNAMEKLRRALDGRDLASLNEGANVLGPVIGVGARDKIAQGLADYLGVPVDATMPALGAVEQAVVAVLGQQDPAIWSDGDALRGYLSGQKASFAAAIPAAFATAVAPPAPAPVVAAPPQPPAPKVVAPRSVPPPSAPVAAAPAPMPPPPRASSGGATWIVVLIVLIAVAAGAWYYMTQMHTEPKAGSLAPAASFAQLAAPDVSG